MTTPRLRQYEVENNVEDTSPIPHYRLTQHDLSVIDSTTDFVDKFHSARIDEAEERLEAAESANPDNPDADAVHQAQHALTMARYRVERDANLLCYRAGQREGLRLAVRLLSRLKLNLQGIPDHTNEAAEALALGAMVDDEQADRLVAILGTGNPAPTFLSGEAEGGAE